MHLNLKKVTESNDFETSSQQESSYRTDVKKLLGNPRALKMQEERIQARIMLQWF